MVDFPALKRALDRGLMDQPDGSAVLDGGCGFRAEPTGEMDAVRMAMGPAGPALRVELRAELRAATRDVHDRLHLHLGFASIQDTTIGLADYRNLVARLYGFYVPFEAAMAIEPDRSHWLARDLEALGLEPPFHGVPKCEHVACPDNVHFRLGALYVAEGSALGGRDLVRGLDGLFGKGATQGRQFFIGRGAGTGAAWRHYLARLSASSPEPLARAEIIRGATLTFAAFEQWLNGWSTSSHG